jgi:hypothetical protein
LSKPKILIVGSKLNYKHLTKNLDLRKYQILFHDEDLRKFNFKKLNLGFILNVIYYFVIQNKFKNKFNLSFKNFVYLICLVLNEKPKIILTINDVSLVYQTLVFNFPNIKCLAIQNGNKTRKDLRKIINHDIYFTYGDYEKKLFKSLNIKYNKIIPVGSFYAQKIKDIKLPKRKNLYDICMISQYQQSHTKEKKIYSMIKSIETMSMLLSKLVNNSKLKICIILRENSKEEINFYKQYFDINKKNIFFIRTPNNKSCYKYLFQSEICISFYSSLIKEALGFRRKAFFMDFTKRNFFNEKEKSLIIYRNNSFINFKKFFNKIYNMTEEEFFKKNSKKIHFYMSNFYLNKPNTIINKLLEVNNE